MKYIEHMKAANYFKMIQIPEILYANEFELCRDLYIMMIDIYSFALQDEIIDQKTIKKHKRRIDAIDLRLKDNCTPQVHLECWLMIGATIEIWMNQTLNEEKYEWSRNLQQLFYE